MKIFSNIVSLLLIVAMALQAYTGDICWTIYMGFLLMFNINLNGRDK